MRIRKLNLFCDILAVLAFCSAYICKSFAETKLGFVRWLNYNGEYIKKIVPMEHVEFVILIILILLLICVFILVRLKKVRFVLNDKIMLFVAVLVTLFYVYAIFNFDYEYSQAYFLIIPLIGLGDFFIIIRCMTSDKDNRYEK
ncbi:hypothetical protein [Mogibacterium sp.]